MATFFYPSFPNALALALKHNFYTVTQQNDTDIITFRDALALSGEESFIHSGYLYTALSRNLLRGALSPATAKEKCLKKLAEGRHIVPGQHAQRKRKFFPSGGANHREISTLFKRRAESVNSEWKPTPLALR